MHSKMIRKMESALAAAMLLLQPASQAVAETPTSASSVLAQNFKTPTKESQPWCYWFWLNGYVSRDGIIRDLDHMQTKGIAGAMVFHSGGGMTEFNTEFITPQWREMFKFAVEEAAKRGIIIGLNACAGYNAGGPWVTPEEAPQFLDSNSATTKGPGRVTLELPAPKRENTVYYKDIAVLAWKTGAKERTPLQSETMVDVSDRLRGDKLEWDAPEGKWTVVRFGYHNPVSLHHSFLKFGDFFELAGRGILTYTREGEIVRHWEIDPLRADTMEKHLANTLDVLAKDVGEHAGKTLKFVQIDSSEIGNPDWTPALREEFKKRRGYDPLPYLAAKNGATVDNTAVTQRFQEDYNRTLGELMVENYYARLAEGAHRYGMLASSQGAGQQKPRLDALAALGCNDICEGEFWTHLAEPPSPENPKRQPSYPHANMTAPDYIHQLCEPLLLNHDSIRTAASAAHTFGRDIVMAEAFSHGAPPRDEFPGHDSYPYSLKDVADRAFCAGLNRAMFCYFTLQPTEDQPGITQPKNGTDQNRNMTWWKMGEAWTAYLSRCQGLLQAGRFMADVCYFPGEWVPNYIPAKWANNPELPPGFDCDTVNANILREAAVGPDGRLELKSGMRYRYLVFRRGGPWKFNSKMTRQQVLEEQQPMAVSPATLAKIKSLVENGMTLVGSRPARAIGLTGYPQSDAEVARLADEIWGKEPADSGDRKVGKGRVVWGKTLADLFAADSLKPDLEIKEDAATAALPAETLSNIPNPTGSFDWIHRTMDGMEIYFIANLRRVDAAGEFTFRVNGRKPELWDPVMGTMRELPQAVNTKDGRTAVPMKFAARQSFFVVFRDKEEKAADGAEQFPALMQLQEITGPWEVQFDPQWFYPDTQKTGGKMSFERLVDWKEHTDSAVKHFSGTATYRKQLSWKGDVPVSGLYLDLGIVRNIAKVRLNGRDLGVVWTAPWHVDTAPALKTGENQLEIEVVNLWPNRMIGDCELPAEERRTKHNISEKLVKGKELFSSGLLGPVTIRSAAKQTTTTNRAQ